jgi:hypothetical protein
VCLKSNHYELKILRDVSAYGPIGPSVLYFPPTRNLVYGPLRLLDLRLNTSPVKNFLHGRTAIFLRE